MPDFAQLVEHQTGSYNVGPNTQVVNRGESAVFVISPRVISPVNG